MNGINFVMLRHISMTKRMICRKKLEISGFFATQIPIEFLKIEGMTSDDFKPLAGFEPSQGEIME